MDMSWRKFERFFPKLSPGSFSTDAVQWNISRYWCLEHQLQAIGDKRDSNNWSFRDPYLLVNSI